MSIFPIVWLFLLILNIILEKSVDLWVLEENEDIEGIIYWYYNITNKIEKIKLFSYEFNISQNLEIYVNRTFINKSKEYELEVNEVLVYFENNEINMENMFKNISSLMNEQFN